MRGAVVVAFLVLVELAVELKDEVEGIFFLGMGRAAKTARQASLRNVLPYNLRARRAGNLDDLKSSMKA